MGDIVKEHKMAFASKLKNIANAFEALRKEFASAKTDYYDFGYSAQGGIIGDDFNDTYFDGITESDFGAAIGVAVNFESFMTSNSPTLCKFR